MCSPLKPDEGPAADYDAYIAPGRVRRSRRSQSWRAWWPLAVEKWQTFWMDLDGFGWVNAQILFLHIYIYAMLMEVPTFCSFASLSSFLSKCPTILLLAGRAVANYCAMSDIEAVNYCEFMWIQHHSAKDIAKLCFWVSFSPKFKLHRSTCMLRCYDPLPYCLYI